MVMEAPIPQGPYHTISFDHVFSKTSGAHVIDPLTFNFVRSSAILLTRSNVALPSDSGYQKGVNRIY